MVLTPRICERESWNSLFLEEFRNQLRRPLRLLDMRAVSRPSDHFQFTAIRNQLRVGLTMGARHEAVIFAPDDERGEGDAVQAVSEGAIIKIRCLIPT